MDITRRVAPIWTINKVCINRDRAVRYLHEYQSTLEYISSHIEEEILFIDYNDGYNFGKNYYFLRDVDVYGEYLDEYVYHLVEYDGYILEKPYRYNTLGWFSSIEQAKASKEWQVYSHLITENKIEGIELEREIKLYGPYGCIHMPNLYIHIYPILR